MYEIEHVDPSCTGPQSIGHSNGTLVVVGVDSCCETVRRIVGQLDDFLLGCELGHGDNGTEDLFFDNLLLVSQARIIVRRSLTFMSGVTFVKMVGSMK